MQAYLKYPKYKTGGKQVKDVEITHKICVVPISVGQAYHIGHEGEATLRLIASKFKHAIFIIADGVNKYNYKNIQGWKVDEKEAAALELGVQSGNEWLEWFEQKRKLMPELASVKIEIYRWQDWKQKQEIVGYEKKTNQVYADNSEDIKNITDKTAIDFTRNLVGKSFYKDSLIGLYTQNNAAYLKEEFCVTWFWVSWLCEQYPNTDFVQLYPRESNPVLLALETKFIKPHYGNRYEFLSIHFNAAHTYHLQPKNIQVVTAKGEPSSASASTINPMSHATVTIDNATQERISTLEREVSFLKTHLLTLYHSVLSAQQPPPPPLHLKNLNGNRVNGFHSPVPDEIPTSSPS